MHKRNSCLACVETDPKPALKMSGPDQTLELCPETSQEIIRDVKRRGARQEAVTAKVMGALGEASGCE